LETVFRDYAPKGVRFFYVYKSLAHPEWDGYVQAFSLEERLKHVQEAKKRLGTGIPWIADSMDNRIKHAFGARNNSEFLFDPEGKLVLARQWSDPVALRTVLEERMGQVDRVTRISDLDLPDQQIRKRAAPSGVVPRVRSANGLRATRVVLHPVAQPHYVKLRVEMDPGLLDTGKGQMRLGFHLDPIYGVHWNNLVDPLAWEIKAPEGVLVMPGKGQGPKVEVPSDVDPREFLVEIDRSGIQGNLELVVRYFGCNDQEGWCREVTQRYGIEFSIDRDAGRSMNSQRPRRGFGPGGGRRRFGPGGRGRFRARRDFFQPGGPGNPAREN
jgi:hypothetical protein